MVTLDDARRVIAAAEDEARKIGQPMNIAVVDGGGNLVSHVRMDGAWIGSIDIAINKAFTARAFDISTAQLAENSQPGQRSWDPWIERRPRHDLRWRCPIAARRIDRRRNRCQRRHRQSGRRRRHGRRLRLSRVELILKATG